MSIDTAPETTMSTISSKPLKEKSGKKQRSSEDKKRKREHGEDGLRQKSKRSRSEKPVEEVENDGLISVAELPQSSPFHTQTSTLYLPLAPISQRKPLEGMCAEHLSPLILTYYPPLSGVVLSYSNPRLSESPYHNDGSKVLLQCIDEYAVSWAWVTAEFLLFKPERGGWLEGYVNLENEGHLGLVCWNLFNASIERGRLPKDWQWIGTMERSTTGKAVKDRANYAEDGIGHYVDGAGKKIEGIVRFRVKDIETSHDRERGFLSIEGTMLGEDEEKQLVKQESASRGGKVTPGTRLGGSRALGATSLGVVAEPGADGLDFEGAGHRKKY